MRKDNPAVSAHQHFIVRTVMVTTGVILLGTVIVLLATKTPELGIVTILTNPSRATVRLDGKTVGETPITIQCPAGTRRVEISKRGYKTIERNILLDPTNGEVMYDFSLEPTLPSPSPQDIEAEIEKLKRLAEEAFKRGDYVAPENDNALYYVNQVARLAPGDPFVPRMRERIRQALRLQAQSSPQKNHLASNHTSPCARRAEDGGGVWESNPPAPTFAVARRV